VNFEAFDKLLLELRQDVTVAGIVGANPTANPVRVAGPEPKKDWAQGPGEYLAFVLLRNEGVMRMRRVPVQRARYVALCHGRTYEEASELATAVSNAVHDRGARTYANGIGIYRSFADSGGDQDKDPDTRQPVVPVFIDLIATTQAVT